MCFFKWSLVVLKRAIQRLFLVELQGSYSLAERSTISVGILYNLNNDPCHKPTFILAGKIKSDEIEHRNESEFYKELIYTWMDDISFDFRMRS